MCDVNSESGLCLFRPDRTFAGDWVLRIMNQSVHLMCHVQSSAKVTPVSWQSTVHQITGKNPIHFLNKRHFMIEKDWKSEVEWSRKAEVLYAGRIVSCRQSKQNCILTISGKTLLGKKHTPKHFSIVKEETFLSSGFSTLNLVVVAVVLRKSILTTF